MDEVLDYEYLSKVGFMVESLENKKGLLKEFYLRIDDEKDSTILKGLSINIYFKDREEMTPHIHLKDINGDIEIEVSLINWSIINVKQPKNIDKNWSNFSSIRKRFFKWLKEKGNLQKLFKEWDRQNPDNLLEEYKDNRDISEELKGFLTAYHNPIKLDSFRKEIYSVLSSFFKDNETKEKLYSLTWDNILKEVGLWEKYDLDNTNDIVLSTAKDAVKDSKIWFS